MRIQAVEGGGLSLKELCSRRCISSLSLSPSFSPFSAPSTVQTRALHLPLGVCDSDGGAWIILRLTCSTQVEPTVKVCGKPPKASAGASAAWMTMEPSKAAAHCPDEQSPPGHEINNYYLSRLSRSA